MGRRPERKGAPIPAGPRRAGSLPGLRGPKESAGQLRHPLSPLILRLLQDAGNVGYQASVTPAIPGGSLGANRIPLVRALETLKAAGFW